ncbi:unnamed protein product, partial [Rotaria sordida]
MTYARYHHTATVLTNGKVLVSGGTNDSALNTAELYDPSTGTWTTTTNMNYPRRYHTASILTDGKVLVAGGDSDGARNIAEFYDLSSGTWTITDTMVN